MLPTQLNRGQDANTALAGDVQFQYPNFTQGIVFFRDGTASGARLNYNLLTNEMQFIAPKGDTLALMNEATIKYISIGNDTFFYDKAYLQLVSGNPVAKLAKRVTIKVGDIKKEGGYGGVSSTSAITNYNSIEVDGQAKKLTMQQEITFRKNTAYYIGDVFNHFMPATKKNVVKMFGKKQNEIEQYLKDNKVLLDKEDDLKALITFLNS